MKAKSLLLILTFAFFTLNFAFTGFAQSPQLINYQAVARNTGGQLIMNQNISVRISILSGSATGTVEYSETHTVITNQFGIFNIQIGAGTVISGIFTQISWSSANHFVKVEADETGGTNYQLLGTSQLISVPYALYAEKSGDGFSGNYNDLSNKPTLFDGNYNSLINTPTLFSGTWGDLTGKPTFATVATSGSYNDLLDKPTLFDGSWSSLTGKPTTLTGFGITDAMNTSHAANGITNTNITNWNTAYSWGNHATVGYLTSFTEQDTMLWKKNGNDLFYNSGNIGIGASNPVGKINVFDSSLSRTINLFSNSTTEENLPDASTTSVLLYGVKTGAATNNMALYGRSSGASGGNFGVAGQAGGTSINYGVYGIANGTGSNYGGYFSASGGSNNYGLIVDAGNVGIGTNTPAYRLVVEDTVASELLIKSTSANSYANLLLCNSTNTGQYVIRTDTDNKFKIIGYNSGWQNRLTLDTLGNIGIGTTSPVSTLHVFGNGNGIVSVQRSVDAAMAGFAVMDNITGEKWGIGIRANEKKLRIFEDGDSNNARLTIDEGGNVGIGTVIPGYKLDVAGTMNAQEIRVNGVVLNPGTGSNWSVSGSDIYRLSGNVGIGTTTPTSNLHITGNGAYIKLEDTRTGNGAKTYSMGTSRIAYGDFAIIDESISATTARLYIQSGGNIGIGTTNPEYKFDVRGVGSSQIFGSDTIQNIANFSYFDGSQNFGPVLGTLKTDHHSVIMPNNTDLDLIFGTRVSGINYERVRITSSGNVGIGTTNPLAKLHTYSTGNTYNIFESSSISGALNYLSFAYNGVSKGYVGFGSTDDIFRVTSLFNNDMMFMTNNLERIRILANGNVGIGTTNPSAKLEIEGSGDNLYLSRNAGGENIGCFQLGISGSTDTPNLAFNSKNSSKASILDNVLFLNYNGNVGIGTGTPSAKLDLGNSGNIRFGDRGGFLAQKISNTSPSNNEIVGLKTGTLVHVSWNGGNGYALLLVKTGIGYEAPIIIASSNSDGGNNSFDTSNNFDSNGGNGIGVFSSSGNFDIQLKTNYTGGDVYVTILGNGAQ